MNRKVNKVQTSESCVPQKGNGSRDNCFHQGAVVMQHISSLKIYWLNSEEAAAMLRLSVGALRNMTSNGQIPFYKLGNRNRYRRDELESLLLSQKKGKLWASS